MVTEKRYRTFWASNTLLFLLLSVFREIQRLGWQYHFLVNLSESGAGHLLRWSV